MDLFPDSTQIAGMSIAAVKSLVGGFGENAEHTDFIDLLRQDNRTGVKAIARTLENRMAKKQNLLRKMEDMLAIEKKLRAEGMNLIAGIDEAGRGPLAGPVVSASVILPEHSELTGLDDSKKMTAQHREEMFERITNCAAAWGIGMAENDEIDEIGILAATMASMRRAVENMGVTPDIALVDGNKTPGLACSERAVIGGDAASLSIAAASVIAKVTRDRLMAQMDQVFPGYGFARHKGYGASLHAAAIARLGPCGIHRFSFRLVTSSAPSGTCMDILKKRLNCAPTPELLERAAAGIARVKESLTDGEIDELRALYTLCKKRFGETS